MAPPITDEGLEEEQARFAMLVAHNDPETVAILTHVDAAIRQMLTQHVSELVPAKSVATTVDLLRAFTNGIVLDTVQNPAAWPARRQLKLLDSMLFALLGAEAVAGPKEQARRRRAPALVTAR